LSLKRNLGGGNSEFIKGFFYKSKVYKVYKLYKGNWDNDRKEKTKLEKWEKKIFLARYKTRHIKGLGRWIKVKDDEKG
jgi:hypothetical protein